MKASNPYIGPRAFEENDRPHFFGRELETRQLVSLVIARQVVLLYAPSGAGKTSLLQAGVIPALQQDREVEVLPISRVGGDIPPDIDGNRVKNIYVFNTLLDLSDAETQAAELLVRTLSDGLANHLASQPDRDSSQPCLLILDQFEELFTLHPDRYPERADFFLQLQNCLKEHPQLSLLLSMREDYIAQLDSYAAQLPDRLRTRFRLELLGEKTARQAVQRPARQQEINFTDAAAEKLVDDLRKVQIQQPDGSMSEQLGRYVEPVQLQVVCRRLWEKLPPDAAQIGETDVEAVGDVDTALANYYAERVKTTSGSTHVRERAIREWFDRQLITEQGIRGQVLKGPEQSQGLDNQAITPLVDAHLIRAEKRLNAIWYELAHDRLIEPVRRNNAEWFQQHLSPLQRQADLWENQNRPNGLLLRDDALEEAERWAAENQDELTSTEHDFLAACQEARAIAEKEQRQARRIRWLAIVSTIIGIIAIIAAVFAMIQRRSAQENAEIAKVRAVEAEDERNRAKKIEHERTRSLFESHLTHASLLARVEDYAAARKILNESRELDEDVPAERRHARNLMAWFTDLMGGKPIQTYTGAEAVLYNVALSPDGHLLATVGEKGTVVLFDPKSGRLLKRLPAHTENVWGVVFHPQNHWLITAGEDLRIIFWSLPEGDKLREWEAPGEVMALALSPDSRYLASGGSDKNVTLWDVETGEILQTLRGHTDRIGYFALNFSPDGRFLISGSADKTARIWEIQTGTTLHTLHGHTLALNGVTFHPNGQIVATSSDDESVRLWQASSGEALRVLQGHTNEVSHLTFLDSGNQLASSSRDRTIRLWDVDSGVTLRVLQDHMSSVSSVAARGKELFSAGSDHTLKRWNVDWEDTHQGMRIFDISGNPVSSAIAPDGSSVAVGFADGAVRLYAIPDLSVLWEHVEAHSEAIYSVAFSPDMQNLASTSFDKTLKLWQPGTGRLTKVFHSPEGLYRVSFAPNSASVAASGLEGQIGLFDVTGTTGRFYKAHEGSVNSVIFDATDQLLLSTGKDGETRLWQLKPWPPVQMSDFPLSSGLTMWAAFSSDGRRVASVGRELRLRILRPHDNAEEQLLAGHEDLILRAIFSPDGNLVATVSTDATIRFWDLTARQELFTLRLPDKVGSPPPLWDFDFRCIAQADSRGDCWMLVPLLRGKLVLYYLGPLYD